MNPIPQVLIDWTRETLNRFFEKQPQYFKYWTFLSYLGMAVSGIPYLLKVLNITLPEPFDTLSNKFVSGTAVAMFVMSKLTIKTTIVGQTEEGQAITVLDKTKMPFTSASEAKEVKEAVPPPEVLPEVPEPESIKDDTTKP